MARIRALAALIALLALVPASLRAQEQRCFPETGYCIAGRIRDFWEQNGGLPVFGFPVGPQQEELVEGKPSRAHGCSATCCRAPSIHGGEPWISDGTPAGTRTVKGINTAEHRGP